MFNRNPILMKFRALLIITLLGMMSACATTTGIETAADTNSDDSLEKFNRASFQLNETLDRSLLKPLAETYVTVTPMFVRNRITNFFDNLGYLNVVLNSFLQGKFDQGMSDFLRVLYNTTFGIAGLFDVSTAMGAPRHEEDFGQTLATWGVDQGSYLYVPLGGPDTARNLPNRASSILLNPFTYINSTLLFPLTMIQLLNTRAELLDETNIRDEAAMDPYTFTREAYLQRREYLIYDGNPPVEGYDDIFDDTEDESGGSLVIE